MRGCLHCNAQCSDCGENDLNASADRTSPGVKPARYSVVTNSLKGRNLTTWHLKSTCSLDLFVVFGLHKTIVCSNVRPLHLWKFAAVSDKPVTSPSCTLRRWRQHIENLYHISQHRIADNRMPHSHRSNRLTVYVYMATSLQNKNWMILISIWFSKANYAIEDHARCLYVSACPSPVASMPCYRKIL